MTQDGGSRQSVVAFRLADNKASFQTSNLSSNVKLFMELDSSIAESTCLKNRRSGGVCLSFFGYLIA